MNDYDKLRLRQEANRNGPQPRPYDLSPWTHPRAVVVKVVPAPEPKPIRIVAKIRQVEPEPLRVLLRRFRRDPETDQ